MYLLYEHLKSPEGELLATDMLMTSWFPGKPGIDFRSPIQKGFFEFTKLTFKKVHISQRGYDPDTKIWTFFGDSGKSVYKDLKNSPMGKVGFKIERILGLSEQVKAGFIKKPEKLAFDPADFFYTPEAPVSSGPTKEQVSEKLAVLLGISAEQLKTGDDLGLKKLYRQAALRLHPDRNGGDSKGMTELNYFWQIYSA